MSSDEVATAGQVLGDGPFVEVGTPSAIAVRNDLVVVGGDLGIPQWNGSGFADRSVRVGYYPVGFYRSDLTCLWVITSGWEVNCIAIHPTRRLVAVGTGGYDGGYFFEGELLLCDVDRETTVSVLKDRRCVERLEWTDESTLAVVVAPPDDWEIDDWSTLRCELWELEDDTWDDVPSRSIRPDVWTSVEESPRLREPGGAQSAVAELIAARGRCWTPRSRAWTVLPDQEGLLVGSDSAIEAWGDGPDPTMRLDLDGSCTQLFRIPSGILASVWRTGGRAWDDRPTDVLLVDSAGERPTSPVRQGGGAVVVARSDGHVLLRPTGGSPRDPAPTEVWGPYGEQVGEVALSGYDLFNHFFDIRRAPEFFVLAGHGPRPHEDKWIEEVRQASGGAWTSHPLFTLAWDEGRHMFGGPGVYLNDSAGTGIVHSGAIHDYSGMQPGSAFLVRRRYPDGKLLWHVPFDNRITALDEAGGRIVAVTNLGELTVVDASTGAVRSRQDRFLVNGHSVVPLSLAMTSPHRGWMGLLDGRAVELGLDPW